MSETLVIDPAEQIAALNREIRALEAQAHQKRIERNALIGLPAPPTYKQMEETLDDVIRSLDDASGVVDPGEDEEYAYENELFAAKINLYLLQGYKDSYEMTLRDAPGQDEDEEEEDEE